MTNRRQLAAGVGLAVLAAILPCRPLAAQEEIEGPPEPPKLPSGAEVLDRYLEVTGGKDAYKKLKTRFERGVYLFPPDGEEGAFEVYAAAPNFFHKTLNAGARGTLIDGVSGETVWSIHPTTGPRVRTGPARDITLRQYYFHRHLNWRDLYEEAVCEDLVTFDAVECYQVSLSVGEGANELHFYERETGLYRGTQVELAGDMGKFVLVVTFFDYRETGGIRVPFKSRQVLGGLAINIRYDTIKFNVDIPEDRFDLPPGLPPAGDAARNDPGASPGGSRP